MIMEYVVGSSNVSIEPDICGEKPIYIYFDKNRNILLYSSSIKCLLDDNRIGSKLSVSTVGISFILQSGVIPMPHSIYNEVYILGAGFKANVVTVGSSIDIKFENRFPFLRCNSERPKITSPNYNDILQLVAEATVNKIDDSKESFLFHSAGKDSNTIALALAEAGWQNKVTLVTHQPSSGLGESQISASIAKKLGFKHTFLKEENTINNKSLSFIKYYFENSPFPCIDDVAITYSLYLKQLPALIGANIIDGGGNDSYMMTPLSRRESNLLLLSNVTHYLHFLRKYTKTEGVLSALIRTPSEWFGMSGLSYSDSKMLFPKSHNVYPFWRETTKLGQKLDSIDFKTSIYTGYVSPEMHLRKVRNFADSFNSNMIFPFMDSSVVEYFSSLRESNLFDLKSRKNKIVLRKLLKDYDVIDSDVVGKVGYESGFINLVRNEKEYLLEILSSDSHSEFSGMESLLSRLSFKSGHIRKDYIRDRMIYRLYMLNSWLTGNKFSNVINDSL